MVYLHYFTPGCVSILARPFERALPRAALPKLSSVYCFNPRPPFRAGATNEFEHVFQTEEVSILARPFERALQQQYAEYRAQGLFQSSPALSSGRYSLNH